MSRIGKKIISLEKGVDVKQEEDIILVKGPKGQISVKITEAFQIVVENSALQLKMVVEDKRNRLSALYGLYGALIKNAVIGVTTGFKKTLSLVGVGYKVQLQGKKLNLALGYSHPIEIDIPDYIKAECPDQTTIVLESNFKDKLGQFVAQVRSHREPEPYKGKGIRYLGEFVRRKAGKTGKK